tara:strand:+ start:3048 stop:3308 length:261 start_codon:yes stop_codon:yes gene_type:complete
MSETKSFEFKFAKIYPNFTRNLVEACGELTSTEIRVCMLIKMNYSNKEIIKNLNISSSTLANSRSSIRKKLRLKRNKNLSNFLLIL